MSKQYFSQHTARNSPVARKINLSCPNVTMADVEFNPIGATAITWGETVELNVETNAANIFDSISPALTQPGSAFADLPIPAWNRNCQEKAKAVKQIEEWEKKKKVANPYKTKYVFTTPPKESASVAHFFLPPQLSKDKSDQEKEQDKYANYEESQGVIAQ